ncbi:nuclear transport factor 2 family protein [Gramella lutea]|uniref:Nuclear transport factor 2 family protein n=1 Tax=Christiangramia lutea TaxID=1607951 RepID=A0A9X2AB59_9FLAO|nr:nuclear transport factor 2 family protein [Christiangramia lutea]MCH4822808.1 nuclear transport factor 2 family protein [Christiangramia lutea]
MKSLLLTIIGLFVIVNAVNSQTVYKNLQDLRDAYVEALKNSDTETILNLYSDDASIHSVDGKLVNGSNEIRSLYNDFFKNSKATIEFKNVSEDKLSDDIFFYHDKVFLNIEGDENTRDIEVVNIAQRVDGKWRVIKSYRWPKP